jgi:hypothetical protein
MYSRDHFDSINLCHITCKMFGGFSPIYVESMNCWCLCKYVFLKLIKFLGLACYIGMDCIIFFFESNTTCLLKVKNHFKIPL